MKSDSVGLRSWRGRKNKIDRGERRRGERDARRMRRRIEIEKDGGESEQEGREKVKEVAERDRPRRGGGSLLRRIFTL